MEPQVAFVMWEGNVGGAETFTCYLAAELRELGVDARVVFVQGSGPIAARLGELAVPWIALNYPRGRSVVRMRRGYARAVRDQGRHAAVLVCGRYLAASLRLGGYKGRIIAVNHGDLQEVRVRPPRGTLDRAFASLGRRLRTLDRAVGGRAVDVEVAVSNFMLDEMRSRPHTHDLRCIPYGIDVDRFRPNCQLNASGTLRVGWAGRMIPGKGADRLLDAARILADAGYEVRMRIAGDGPMKAELAQLSERLELGEGVEFVGRIQDMPSFWNSCDLAAASSDEFVESFGLTPLEAAACGRPAVVSRRGGLVETVLDHETGILVPPGDSRALADAIARYATDGQMLEAHGRNARMRAVREFSMERCASSYLAAVS